MTKQTFLQGTLILMIAGVIIKILGFVNKIIIVRLIGQEGVGLYAMAYPTLLLTVTLTQLGLPVAISKMVAEADALNDRKKIKRILVVSFVTTGILSIAFTSVMIILGPWLGRTVFTDARTVYPLMAIAPIVPIVAVASVFRGYFQGMSNMRPYAFSQIIEQVVRISLVGILATLLLPYGIEYAAAGVMIAGVIGEAISLAYMITMFKMKKSITVRRGFWLYLKNSTQTLRDLMRVALPSTGSKLVGNISYFFEPIVVANSLMLAGVSTQVATTMYGSVSGMAIPVLFLPSFITYSLSVSLVPTISEAAAKKRSDIIQYRLHQALKIAMIAGGLSAVILYVFAYPIMHILYDAKEVGKYVKIMAPFSFLIYFQGPLQASLQALDLAKTAMINSIIGAAAKLIAIFALASIPELNITGFALAFALSAIVVTLLHFASVVKSVGYTVIVSDYVKGFLCIAVTGLIAQVLYKQALLSLPLLPRTALLITIVVVLFGVFISQSGLLHKEEVAQLPVIGRFAAKWIRT